MKDSNASSNLMKPKLSVVVGSQNARGSIVKCLTALESQRNGQEVEIIIVDNSTDGTADIISKQFSGIKFLRAGEDKFMPELWEVGINQSSGEVVALTTSHFVPQKNWIEEILKAHQSSYAGVGGAIENEQTAGLISWAVYFCRYSPYMLPLREATVNDFAGDNASYKRSVLERFSEARRNGFWESSIHAEMKKNGLELLVSPNIVVYHQKPFSLAGFMNQRFWHGRQFGSERALSISSLKRMIYVLLSPMIPVVFLSRITWRVFNRRKHIKEYLLSLPILMLFLLSWSAGELTGYLWVLTKRGEVKSEHQKFQTGGD